MRCRPAFTLGLLLLPGAAAAQLQMAVVARVGLYAPQRNLGPAAPAQSMWYLHAERPDPTVSFELQLQAALPATPLALRVTGLRTLPTSLGGFFDCYPGLACPAILARAQSAESTVLSAVADLVYTPFDAGSVRPYAVLGGGFKQYRFSWGDQQDMVQSGRHRETTPAAHAALGLEVHVLGAALLAELADYWSPVGRDFSPTTDLAGDSVVRRREQHDLGATIGWRLIRF